MATGHSILEDITLRVETRAFDRLALGLSQLAGASIPWSQAAPLFQAAARMEIPGAVSGAPPSGDSAALLELRKAGLHHENRSAAVLRNAACRFFPGDRVLLESGSGSGRSSLPHGSPGCAGPNPEFCWPAAWIGILWGGGRGTGK